MRPNLLPLLQRIISHFINTTKANHKDTPNMTVPVIQSVFLGEGVQLLTQLGGVFVLNDNSKIENDTYAATNIGDPTTWSKIQGGLIKSTKAEVLPVDKSVKAAAIGDQIAESALRLLKEDAALAPVTVLAHPANILMLLDDGGKSVTWLHGSEEGFGPRENMSAVWTANYVPADHYISSSLFGVVREWHKALVQEIPKSSDGESKISGISLSNVGSYVVLHLVCRSMNMVVSLVCSIGSGDVGDYSYIDPSGNLIRISCDKFSNYNIKKEKNMKINMIDISKVSAKPEETKVQVSEAAPQAHVEVPAADTQPKIEPPEVADKPETEAETEPPVSAEHVQDTATAVVYEEKQEDRSFDEILKNLQTTLAEFQDQLRNNIAAVKALQGFLKALNKAHRQEIKDIKGSVKENEELTKLRSSFSVISKALEQLR